MHPTIHHANWFKHDCNNTKAIDYDLNKDSLVVDLGGFKGLWVAQMEKKYDCNFFIYEPVAEYCEILKQKFSHNEKVKVFNFAIHPSKRESFFYKNGDGSSSHLEKGQKITICYENLTNHLESLGVESVDLAQINIEGDEYDVLEDLISSGKIKMFKNLQIQFHDFVPKATQRRNGIRKKLLENNWSLNWDYPWVFESWSKK